MKSFDSRGSGGSGPGHKRYKSSGGATGGIAKGSGGIGGSSNFSSFSGGDSKLTKHNQIGKLADAAQIYATSDNRGQATSDLLYNTYFNNRKNSKGSVHHER